MLGGHLAAAALTDGKQAPSVRTVVGRIMLPLCGLPGPLR